MQVLETVTAEALPSNERLQRFRRLAKMQLSRVGSFNRWAEQRELNKEQKDIAQEAWNAAWTSNRVEECFEVLKRLSVFDESFRLPDLQKDSAEFRGNVEEKFGKLMLAVSLLTLTIQRDYEKTEGKEESWPPLSSQLT
jgi:hypothetical protein